MYICIYVYIWCNFDTIMPYFGAYWLIILGYLASRWFDQLGLFPDCKIQGSGCRSLHNHFKDHAVAFEVAAEVCYVGGLSVANYIGTHDTKALVLGSFSAWLARIQVRTICQTCQMLRKAVCNSMGSVYP